MKKCFVAISGGVDSAVALILLRDAGYDVEGVTMIPFGSELLPDFSGGEINDAKALCDSLGIKHHAVDLKSAFRETVIADFIDSYKNGETPNPCIVCNKCLKFGLLAEFAFENGADYYATGHYVRVLERNGRRVIATAENKEKDQSYMLWSVDSSVINRFLAPLGKYSKPEVREIATKNKMAVAEKGDSQDICFIPDGDYRGFLGRIAPFNEKQGDFILSSGEKLGRHQGQTNYTIGQRKGLGIAYREPLYVIGRDIPENKIILGTSDKLLRSKFTVRNANFNGIDTPSQSLDCEVRIRYRAPFTKARITPLGDNRFKIETLTPVRAVTAGQSAVFYDGDVLLGGGIIE